MDGSNKVTERELLLFLKSQGIFRTLAALCGCVRGGHALDLGGPEPVDARCCAVRVERQNQ